MAKITSLSKVIQENNLDSVRIAKKLQADYPNFILRPSHSRASLFLFGERDSGAVDLLSVAYLRDSGSFECDLPYHVTSLVFDSSKVRSVMSEVGL